MHGSRNKQKAFETLHTSTWKLFEFVLRGMYVKLRARDGSYLPQQRELPQNNQFVTRRHNKTQVT